MSALAAARNTPEYLPFTSIRSYPVAASQKIYQGGIVVLNASGYAQAGTTATGLLCVGRANQTVDNTAGADAALQVEISEGIFQYANGNSIAQAGVGGLCYIVDDQTVSSNASGKSIAGVVCAIDSLGVWVSMGLEAAIDDTALTAYINNVASTSHAEGASLVGVEDAAGYFAATNVEDALTEVTEEPIFIYSSFVTLSQIADAGIIAAVKPGFKCKIIKTEFNPTVAASTSAKATTLTTKIAGSSVTGGVLALTTANCNTAGTVVEGTAVTAAQSVAATNLVTVVASSTTAFVEGAGMLSIMFGRA